MTIVLADLKKVLSSPSGWHWKTRSIWLGGKRRGECYRRAQEALEEYERTDATALKDLLDFLTGLKKTFAGPSDAIHADALKQVSSLLEDFRRASSHRLSRRGFVKALAGFTLVTSIAGLYLFRSNRGIPVLMYHDIVSDDDSAKGDRYTVSISRFNEQMAYLAKNGFQAITVSEMAELRFASPLKRYVVISFDDALKGVLLARGVLEKLGFVAVVSVVTGRVGSFVDVNESTAKQTMTLEDLRSLQSRGWEIASHTHDLHSLGRRDINTLSRGDRVGYLRAVAEDLAYSKRFLNENFPGQSNDILVWPFNFHSDDVSNLAFMTGFKKLLTTNVHQLDSLGPNIGNIPGVLSAHVTPDTDLRFIPRIEISNTVDITEFKRRVENPLYMFLLKASRKFGLSQAIQAAYS